MMMPLNVLIEISELLLLSSSLSYTCSHIAPIFTPLFHADPLHPRGGWWTEYVSEHFNDNDDSNDTINSFNILIFATDIIITTTVVVVVVDDDDDDDVFECDC